MNPLFQALALRIDAWRAAEPAAGGGRLASGFRGQVMLIRVRHQQGHDPDPGQAAAFAIELAPALVLPGEPRTFSARQVRPAGRGKKKVPLRAPVKTSLE